MKILNVKTGYLYKKGGCGSLFAGRADGQLSVFQNSLPHYKGKYFLFND
ncbi:MAG: hypothetical protein IJX81_01540 [Clostridia bacterium]|nr:hypothetical protein [Clostridia bacterium]